MKLRSVVLIILLSYSFLLQAMDESPGQIVKETVDQVLVVLKHDSLNEQKQKQMISELISQRVNFKDMSRRIMAINWKNASADQQEEFTTLFKQILLNTYWIRMNQYAGEKVEFIAVSSDKEGYATVDTIIIRDGSNIEIPISYRMKSFVNLWFAYDFVVETLSLVQSYRNEYGATIKNFGVDGLLKLMKQEVDGYDVE